MLPHYEVREAVYFDTDTGRKANNTMLTTLTVDQVFGHNVVFNATDQREINFVVNGADGSANLLMTGIRCVDDCDTGGTDDDDDDEDDVDDGIDYWSDPASWTNNGGNVPLEGDEVVIGTNMNLVYDLGESPIFKSVEVNGILSFKKSEPAVLKTYSLWVRAGTLNVGTEEEPFDSTVEIRLHGNITSPSEFVFTQQVPVSNKNFIITGTVNMFGKKRSGSARLL